jgi:toxin ParE1/3/4
VKHKRVIPRTQADRDVQEAVDYYLNEGAERAALAFVDAIEQASGT